MGLFGVGGFILGGGGVLWGYLVWGIHYRGEGGVLWGYLVWGIIGGSGVFAQSWHYKPGQSIAGASGCGPPALPYTRA